MQQEIYDTFYSYSELSQNSFNLQFHLPATLLYKFGVDTFVLGNERINNDRHSL